MNVSMSIDGQLLILSLLDTLQLAGRTHQSDRAREQQR